MLGIVVRVNPVAGMEKRKERRYISGSMTQQ